jgi:hypothetical protein
MTAPTVPAPDARDEYAPPTIDELAALTADLLTVATLPPDDPRRAVWVARKDALLGDAS